MIDDYVQINQLVIFAKIDTVRRLDDLYHCNDLINILSDSIARDVRLVNDFTSDELVIRTAWDKTQYRRMRYLTLFGVARYIHDGKIYSYANACAYFSLEPINKQHAKWKKSIDAFIINDMFSTKHILQWLFERKKSCAALGIVVSKQRLAAYLAETAYYNKERADYLIASYLS